MGKQSMEKQSAFSDSFRKICAREILTGAHIIVTNRDKILENVCYGYADKEREIKTDEDTIYRIASISKTVGAIAVMQLREQGLLDLDRDISEYLGYKVINPGFPQDIITLRMLVTQTSSILDGYDDENPAYDDIVKGYNGVNGHDVCVSLQELLTDPSSPYYTPLTFGDYRPGDKFRYSNFGCGIMACIIEKVSGETYVEYMENHILKPLGLDASFRASRIEKKEKIASMYWYKDGKIARKYPKEIFIDGSIKTYPLGDNFRGPAGGLFIGMKDLSKIMRMFLNYGTAEGVTILSRESTETMYQMHWCGNPKGESYRAKGIQMKIQNDNGIIPLRGHTGGAYGLRSYFFFNLKEQIGACFVTNGINSSDVSAACDRIFTETQAMFVSMYTHPAPDKIIFVGDNEILLEERKITDKEMFLSEGKFIKLTAFADAFDIIPVFGEKDDIPSLVLNGKNYLLTDAFYYHHNLYIPFMKTLDEMGITHEKKNGLIVINIQK